MLKMLDHEMLIQNPYWQCTQKKVNTALSILVCNLYWDLPLNAWRQRFCACEEASTRKH